MSIFFTADHHFGHKGIIEYCNRPFSCTHDMNKYMIDQWNSVVGKKDIIYHLGDFSMSGTNSTKAILERLNGLKYLCIGSHDKSAAKCFNSFEDIADTMFISVHGVEIFMAHHCHKVWPKSHYGSYHLFGHSHCGLNKYTQNEGKLLDVGVDCHEFKPWSIEEIKEVMATRPDNFNLVKRRY